MTEVNQAVSPYRIPAINSEGRFFGKGLEAAMMVNFGRTVNVCSPEFGADPTGKTNSRPAIQKAIDHVSASGGGTVVVDAGDYLIDAEGLNMKGLVHLKGAGRFVTRLWLDASTVTESTVERGLIGIGTYGQRLQDRTLFRTSITDLSIQSTYKDGTLSRSSNGSPFQHIGGENIQNKIWGICYNGYLGSGPAEPDSVHYMDNVEIWDMNGGWQFSVSMTKDAKSPTSVFATPSSRVGLSVSRATTLKHMRQSWATPLSLVESTERLITTS